MRLIKNLGILAIVILVISGCEDVSKREYIDIQYLNAELDDYPNDDIGNDTNDELVKASKDKFIKWTATVTDVKSDKKLILKEEGLPKIEIILKDKMKDASINKGDVITISGSLHKYIHGLFGTIPIWKVREGVILETSDKENEELLSYQKAYSDKKIN